MRKILLSVMGIAVCWALISPIMTASKAHAAAKPAPVPSPSISLMCTGTIVNGNATLPTGEVHITLGFNPLDVNSNKTVDPSKGAGGKVFGTTAWTSTGTCTGPDPLASDNKTTSQSNTPCFHAPTFSGTLTVVKPVTPTSFPKPFGGVKLIAFEQGTLTFGDPYPNPSAVGPSLVGTEPLIGCTIPMVFAPYAKGVDIIGASAGPLGGTCPAAGVSVAVGCTGVHD